MNGDEATPLVIVGAAGLGRETLAAARAVNAVNPTWGPISFVDDLPALAGREIDGAMVLGPVETLESMLLRGTHAHVVISVGRPGATASRVALARRLGDCGAVFATIVHPGAALAAGTQVGAGTILLAGVVTTAPVEIGAHVVAMPHVVFTHDNRIDDFTTFATRATLGGGVHIEELAYLGAGAVIRENLTIGAGSLIGMGSVVTRNVPGDEVWAGNPARPLQLTPPDPAGGGSGGPGGTSASSFQA